MSNIPKDTKSKYNRDEKFIWVDSQLEKFMEKQKLDAERAHHDAEYIENLEMGSVEMEKKILELTIENSELKDRLIELGDKETKYIYESPDNGNTIYRREFGNYSDREKVTGQLNLFDD